MVFFRSGFCTQKLVILFYKNYWIQNSTHNLVAFAKILINISPSSPLSYNPIASVDQIVEKIEDVFEAASLDNPKTNDHFSNFCGSFCGRVSENTDIVDNTQASCYWFFPLKVILKKNTVRRSNFFFERDFSFQTEEHFCAFGMVRTRAR